MADIERLLSSARRAQKPCSAKAAARRLGWIVERRAQSADADSPRRAARRRALSGGDESDARRMACWIADTTTARGSGPRCSAGSDPRRASNGCSSSRARAGAGSEATRRRVLGVRSGSGLRRVLRFRRIAHRPQRAFRPRAGFSRHGGAARASSGNARSNRFTRDQENGALTGAVGLRE